jgi:diadenosine tetraphosphate (Ap4A) HIT family hydrolase
MEDNIFAKIGRGEVPIETVYEDEHVVAFRDVNPQAPVHALVIPKRPVENVLALTPADRELAGAVLLAAAEVAGGWALPKRARVCVQRGRGRRSKRAAPARTCFRGPETGLAARVAG